MDSPVLGGLRMALPMGGHPPEDISLITLLSIRHDRND